MYDWQVGSTHHAGMLKVTYLLFIKSTGILQLNTKCTCHVMKEKHAVVIVIGTCVGLFKKDTMGGK